MADFRPSRGVLRMRQCDESDALAALDEAVRALSKSASDILCAAGVDQQHIERQMGPPLSPAPPVGSDEEDLFASVLLRLKEFEAAAK
jgi:hypothetical protein